MSTNNEQNEGQGGARPKALRVPAANLNNSECVASFSTRNDFFFELLLSFSLQNYWFTTETTLSHCHPRLLHTVSFPLQLGYDGHVPEPTGAPGLVHPLLGR